VELDGKKTVLVVEDEKDFRALLRKILKASGYTVLEASSSTEALRICKQHTGAIHLIIADVIMPGKITGLELLQRVVSMRPEVKRLCISGYMDEAMFRQEIPDQGTAFLQKPFMPDDLLHNVRTLLDAPRQA
jgi:two-component system, cell cycle sensor histidine kinase and response regulator CckA